MLIPLTPSVAINASRVLRMQATAMERRLPTGFRPIIIVQYMSPDEHVTIDCDQGYNFATVEEATGFASAMLAAFISRAGA